MRNKKCIICNLNSMGWVFKKNGQNLYRCNNCDLMSVIPKPALAQLKFIYSPNNNYHSKLDKQFLTKQGKKFYKRLEIIESIIPLRGRKILDVGCSNGDFLDYSKERGYKTYGVELNKTTAIISKKKGHNVFNGKFLDYKTNIKFNAIHLGDIIEHDLNPKKFIKKCKDLLLKNGVIIISTPNSDSFLMRMKLRLLKISRLSWSGALPHYHLYLFSYKNINKLLEQEGFNLIKEDYTKNSLKEELKEITQLNSFYNCIFKKRFKLDDFLKNLFPALLTMIIYPLIFLTAKILDTINNKGNQIVLFYQK